MPLTRYPNGVTVCTTTALVYNAAATDSIGAVDCNNLYVAGTASVGVMNVTTLNVPTTGRFSIGTGTGATMIGERQYVAFTFTSAATTTYYPTPFAGNIIDCWVTADTTPRTCSAFTLYAGGTAGSVAVASVALAYATAIGQQIQPTLTLQTAITATGFAIVVTTAGSACNFSGVFVIQRSA